VGQWRAGPVAGHGLRLRRLRLRGVSRATRSRIVFARPGAIAVLRSVSVYSFAAAAPVVRRYARALRPRIAPPWSASALASQRVRPCLLDALYAGRSARSTCFHAEGEARAAGGGECRVAWEASAVVARAHARSGPCGKAQTNCAQRRLCPRSGCVRLARSSSVASVEAANHGSVRLLGWRSMPRVRCRRSPRS
jgi:hypothetical protein